MTLMGLGAFRADDPLSLDMLGMHGSVYANYAVDQADLLLAFGVRFDDRVTGKVTEFAKHGKIVHIDIDPSEINKNKEAAYSDRQRLEICAGRIEQDRRAARSRSGALAPADRRLEDRPIRSTTTETFAGILPQHAIAELSQLDARSRHDHHASASASIRCGRPSTTNSCDPRTWLSSSGLGTMGFGLPAAMGAKAAHPDRLVVDIDGDGSFLMNIQELATCFCEKIPVKVLLLNNQHLGMVVQWEDRFFTRQPGPHLSRPDRQSRSDRPGRRRRCRRSAIPISWRSPRASAAAAGYRAREVGAGRRPEEMIDYDGPFVLDVASALSGARAADDPLGQDGQGSDQRMTW